VNWGVFVSTVLAATIEVIEMVAIVVAVGLTRSWRAAGVGAAGGLVVLVITIAALGVALRDVSLEALRLVVGALLLAFGWQWYRKGILIVSRDGWMTGVGEEDVDDEVPAGFDWTGVFLSFKGVSLEGLEVAVIVVAFGAAADAIGSAIVGAAASLVVIGAVGAATYRYVAAIPRRALQLFVRAMLVTFGTFWAGQGLSVEWPGEDFALVWLGALYVAAALLLLRVVSGWRRSAEAGTHREAASAPGAA
jgi:Ca2+/H+ antiporter, TMEM165/GDT1 family